MERFREKIIIVTGATSGIGEATAFAFADEGGCVICVGRNIERGAKLMKLFDEHCYKGEYYSCNLSSSSDVTKLKNYVSDKYGNVDILVNSAGVFQTSQLEEISDDEWDDVFRINTSSVMYMTRAFLPQLQKSNGNIVNVASIGGMQSHISGRAQYMYASSKAAVIQFSQLCALNYSKEVRVNCVCPGPTDTPIYSNKDFSRFADLIPMGRIGKPEETAKAVLFLASDDASYISGAILTVDGGASIK